MDLWVKFLGKKYLLKDVCAENDFLQIPSFYNSCILFCKAWLSDQQYFQLQTSGTTGAPKTISVTRDQLRASARLTIDALQLKKDSTALICLDTRYVAGIMMLVRAMEAGINMIWVEPISNPLNDIEDEIDFIALVPLQLNTILKSRQKEKLNKIKVAIIGGASLNRNLKNLVNEISCAIYATYGMTETLSHIALQKINGQGAQEYFETLDTIAISADERGCLVIDAPHISKSKIVTNDIIQLISYNQFYWLGRWDNVINTGGVKVIPEKVETVIEALFEKEKLTNRFFIGSLPDERLGQTINLFIEGKPIPKSIEEIISTGIDSLLSRYERPKSIQYINQFIETDTGKINKRLTISLIQK